MAKNSISKPDLDRFSDEGILCLKGFIPKKLCLAAKESILSELSRVKLVVKGKFASAKIQSLPIFQQTERLAQMLGAVPEVDRLFTDDLIGGLGSLVGKALAPALPQSQLLLSFPHKEQWTLNRLNWHLDLAPPKSDMIPGVQAFILIDDVQPRGGATLALTGSHKLHYTGQDGNAHEVLRQHSEFSLKPEEFLSPQSIMGHKVQIIEMCGRAGDVYLMDLRVLHSPSTNSTRNIRMMATNRYLAV